MPIIDSDKEAKFDALIRTNKDDTLLSFIMATRNAKVGSDIKKEIAKRLKSSYELFREDVKGSKTGAGTFGAEDKDISSQFDSHYTMGYEMGIWQGNDFKLSALAEKVADYEMTVSEYIGIVFLNLFCYFKINGQMVYHHFLYEILTKVKNNLTLYGNIKIPKSIIEDTLPIEKSKEQGNLLFNYLVASDIFTQSGKDNFQISDKWLDKSNILISLCNLEFKDLSFEDAKEKFKDKKTYADYVTKRTEHTQVDSFDEFIGYSASNTTDEEMKNELNYSTGFLSEYPRNRIIFGAPGTGKSYSMNKDCKNVLNATNGAFERVTFYPDYSYSNFVGTYKPVSEGSDIRYEFVPGPFMRVYMEVLKSAQTEDPQPHILLIEEINRAKVSAVFGDTFQLLDRDSSGISEYEINASEDIRRYLAEQLGGKAENFGRLRIPDNMFIWATMNSADQGVFPMDTAFKRRWDFEYIGINQNDSSVHGMINLGKGADSMDVDWNKLRKAINEKLVIDFKLDEDKLMGPFFLSKRYYDADESTGYIKNPEIFIKAFKNKVIMYLYEDAAKQFKNKLFEGCKDRSKYSSVCEEFDNIGIGIFGEGFRELYEQQ